MSDNILMKTDLLPPVCVCKKTFCVAGILSHQWVVLMSANIKCNVKSVSLIHVTRRIEKGFGAIMQP